MVQVRVESAIRFRDESPDSCIPACVDGQIQFHAQQSPTDICRQIQQSVKRLLIEAYEGRFNERRRISAVSEDNIFESQN